MTSGECLCGLVRFQMRGPIGPIVYCHCSMCRRASGSAFAANGSVAASDFHVLAGADLISEYQSSPDYVRAFCCNCGSPVYGRSLAHPGLRRVRVGGFEEDLEQKPRAAVWTSSRAPWYEPSEALDQFSEEASPEYYDVGSTS